MKDTKPKESTRWDKIIVLILVLPVLLAVFVGIPMTIYQDNLDAIFIDQAEKDCRKINWYLEKDTVWRAGILKQVFCRDSTWEKLLFKKIMKYE